jgi:NAD(P)-dependent dehydrogenase (short-subunit alcohol dehydrogenase family)
MGGGVIRNQLSGKVALVSGATRGIGLAIADRLSAMGADIVSLDLPGEDVSALQTMLDQRGRKLLVTCGDVSVASSWSGALEQLLAAFGRLDILVNNAGVPVSSAPCSIIPKTPSIMSWRSMRAAFTWA